MKSADGRAFEALADEVRSNGGLVVCSMERLRDAIGAGRLGTHVRADIAARLKEVELGTLPSELPNDQRAEVRVYAKKLLIGQVIDSVLEPTGDRDRLLMEVTSQQKAIETLEKVRELVHA